jgi:hypothetical protein
MCSGYVLFITWVQFVVIFQLKFVKLVIDVLVQLQRSLLGTLFFVDLLFLIFESSLLDLCV